MTKSLGKPNERGIYSTEIGPRGDEHRFYLGRDARQAEARKARLESLWSIVSARGENWSCMAKEIGKAIARGDAEFVVEPAAEYLGKPVELARSLAGTQALYPTIVLRYSDKATTATADEGERLVEERHAAEIAALDERRETLANAKGFGSSRRLHEALDAFRQHVLAEFTVAGQLSDWGRKQGEQVDRLRAHVEDIPLRMLTAKFANEWVSHWCKRPATKRGKPCARETCQSQIKRLRAFLRWLPSWGWKRPEGFDLRPARIKRLAGEKRKTVATWTRAELVTLWKYATPTERAYIALGLNLGFGRGEIASLRRDEVKGRIVERHRGKSEVYGRWELWDETRAALDWVLSQGVKGDLLFPVKPQGISNAFARLIARIRKDEPAFRSLSFNKFRKTSGNAIKNRHGYTTMRIFHARGTVNPGDEYAENYSNRSFKKVRRAIRWFRKALATVFVVADPFPAKVGKPSISLATIEKIRTMRADGIPYRVVCEALGVSTDTVRRYTVGR